MATPTTLIALPLGVRDILPDEARKIKAVEDAILSVYEKNGFKRVITPMLEYVESLSVGMGASLNDKLLKFVEPSTGRIVAIRPDITPQVARLVATRMRDAAMPIKLCYNESVVRAADSGTGLRSELRQLGAEFISEKPSEQADAEMIIVAIESLKEVGVKDFKIDVGDVGFLRSVLDRLAVGAAEKGALKEAIAFKDGSAIASVLASLSVKIDESDAKLLKSLATLYGTDEVISKAGAITKEATDIAALEKMQKVLDIVAQKGYKNLVTVDLGEVRGFDYYTGIIFEGFASGLGKAILSGGRYDNLMEKYGYSAAATGFAFDVENIVAALNRKS